MTKQTRRREDSFLGIHFDFHAREGYHPVGKVQRPDIFAKMLDAYKPDYLQCDTKGHQGLSSYPTKVGYAVSGIEGDNLQMLRELTAERGIALYAHHSGLYDITAVEKHPEWALVDETDVVSRDTVSVFSPYVRELLIPQLIEIAVDYNLDGAWVDGDCWAAGVDYSENARQAYYAKTGGKCPKPGEAGYEEYREFCREGYRKYVAEYCKAVKAVKPDFQITSNWMYSGFMPEKITVPLDFISGDYHHQNSFNTARFNARCMVNQNIPWDLMAWGQNAILTSWRGDNRSTKELAQTCQEAAAVLALGGGFQLFNHQYAGGGLVQDWAIPLWAAVAAFCREREEFCHKSRPIPQVGVLFSQKAHYSSMKSLFGVDGQVSKRVRGLIDLCADTQIPCDVITSHMLLDGGAAPYGAILVPDSDELESEVVAKLKEYVSLGGSLLLCGPKVAGFFDVLLTETEKKLTYIAYDGRMVSFVGNRADFVSPEAKAVFNHYHNVNYFESEAYPMSIKGKIGSGSMISVCLDLGMLYLDNKTTVARNLFTAYMDELFPNLMAVVKGSSYVDVTLMKKNGKIMVNLINSAGPHNVPDVRGFNEIPPIGPLSLKLRVEKEPEQVTLEPGGKKVNYTYANGQLDLLVDRVEIHTIVVVSECLPKTLPNTI